MEGLGCCLPELYLGVVDGDAVQVADGSFAAHVVCQLNHRRSLLAAQELDLHERKSPV